MAEINVKTKFDVGDSVFGFVDGEIHNLTINRIEIQVKRFAGLKNNPFQANEIIYLATTTDAKYNTQHRFPEETLHTKDELKEYVNKYFEDYDR